MSVRNVVFKGTIQEIDKGLTSFNNGITDIIGGFLPFSTTKNIIINLILMISVFYLFYKEMNFCMKIGRLQGKSNEQEGKTLFIVLILLSYIISVHYSIVLYKITTRFIGDKHQMGGGLTKMALNVNFGMLDNLPEYITVTGNPIESVIIFCMCVVLLIICIFLGDTIDKNDDVFNPGLKSDFRWTWVKSLIYMLVHSVTAITTVSRKFSKVG
jgi:hypothetical protein